MTREDWYWLVGMLAFVLLLTGVVDTTIPKAFDKRSWICAEYDVAVEDEEPVCIRLERATNQ